LQNKWAEKHAKLMQKLPAGELFGHFLAVLRIRDVYPDPDFFYQKYGIMDPRSGIRKKPISDPDPQHCFLVTFFAVFLFVVLENLFVSDIRSEA
jgi:hypothetical protein